LASGAASSPGLPPEQLGWRPQRPDDVRRVDTGGSDDATRLATWQGAPAFRFHFTTVIFVGLMANV
jgi:hypothetical protein